jgi:multisubunit Na+/H+ antiporter MnhG subunit
MALENAFGLPTQAVAVLMIVFGILVIVLPALLSWLVGILLIILGVLWLVGSAGSLNLGRASGPSEPPRRV